MGAQPQAKKPDADRPLEPRPQPSGREIQGSRGQAATLCVWQWEDVLGVADALGPYSQLGKHLQSPCSAFDDGDNCGFKDYEAHVLGPEVP